MFLLLIFSIIPTVHPSGEPKLLAQNNAYFSSSEVANGDGTSNISFWDAPVGQNEIFDTWLESVASTTIHGGAATLELGYDESTGKRSNILVGIDLDAVGFWTNATIISATLELQIRTASTASMEVEAWMPYADWDSGAATWQSSGVNSADWAIPGALGRQDSGGIPVYTTLDQNSTELILDATQTMQLAQMRLAQSGSAEAALLITSLTSGVDCVFDSSEAAFWDMRPQWNVTVQWSSPSMPANVPAWVDIEPKGPVHLSADGQVVFKANLRNQDGTMSADTVSWSSNAGNIDASGVFFPSLTGTTIVTGTGTSSGITGTRDVIVTPGTAQSIMIEPANATFTADDEVVFRAVLSDSHGNDFDATAAQWWVDSGAIDANGSYTFNQTGTFRVDVLAGALSAWTNVTILEGAAATLTFAADISVASGSRIQLIPTLFDRLGNQLNISRAGGLTWQVENGSVDASGWFTGGAVGPWKVWCNGSVGVFGYANVLVTLGPLVYLEIIEPNRTVGADEIVPLPVIWTDEFGNSQGASVPLEYWTAEDGGFQISAGQVEWLPRQSGEWAIEVRIGNVSDIINITVGHGLPDRIYITADANVVSADDDIELILEAEDVRGNRWPTVGEWSFVDSEVNATLTTTENGVKFTPSGIGFWTIKATTIVNNTTLEALRIIEVQAGRLSAISILGHGMTISADDEHDFFPISYDAQGNIITGIGYNWSIDGVDMTASLTGTNYFWNPGVGGDVQIEVDAAGRASRVTMFVTAGEPYSLEVSYVDGNSVRSGEMLVVNLTSSDFDGNQAEADVNWQIPNGAAEVSVGERTGQYEITGMTAGSWILMARTGTAQVEVHISVEPGSPHRIEINAPSVSLKQSESYEFSIVVYDIGGNEVSVDANQITISCTIAEATHRSGTAWTVMMTDSGDGIPFETSIGNVTSTVHLYAEPDAFGYLTGTSSGVAASFSVVTAVFMVSLLILLRRNRKRKAATDDDDESEEFEYSGGELNDSDGAGKVRSGAAPALAGAAGTSGIIGDGEIRQSSRRGQRGAANLVSPDSAAVGLSNAAPPSAPAAAPSSAAFAAPAAPSHPSLTPPAIPPAALVSAHATQSTTSSLTPQAAPSADLFQANTPQSTTQNLTPPTAPPADLVEANGVPLEPQGQIPPTRPASLDSPQPRATASGGTAEPATNFEPAVAVQAALPVEPLAVDKPATTDAPGDVAGDVAGEAAISVASTGVLLASEGTVQGESGWYHDGAGNMSYWNVDAAGNWVQVG